MSQRSYFKKDERRTQLLELGLQLFAERSYDDVSIDDIATAANVSRGLMYHHFGGKRELYNAVLSHAAQRMLSAVEPDPSTDPVENLRNGLVAYLQFVDEHEQAYKALLHGGLGADEEAGAILSHARQTVVGNVVDTIGLSTVPPAWRIAMKSWLGAVEAAALHWLETRELTQFDLVELLGFSLLSHLRTAVKQAPEVAEELAPSVRMLLSH